MTNNVASQIVEALEQEGVDRVFCVPGESFLGITDALCDSDKLKLIVCRHEAGAGLMAIADGQLTHRAGVCMVSRGPGASNVMIALHTALHDAVPLVILIGQVATPELGRQALQEQNYSRWLSDVTKAVLDVNVPYHAAEVIGRAFQIAASGTPGPVAVILPEDVLEMPAVADLCKPRDRASAGPRVEDVQQLALMLQKAKRPLMMVGGAFQGEQARHDLYRLVERWGIPVCSTNRRPHLFDSSHPNFAGYLGIRTPDKLMDELKKTDLLVALGERMTDPVSQSYTFPTAPQPQMPFVHIWPDPLEIGRVWRTDLGMACDPGSVVSALLASPISANVTRGPWVKQLHELQEALTASVWEPTSDGVNFASVVCAVGKHLNKDAIITSDAGNFASFLHRYLRFTDKQHFLSSVIGAMGAGVPMAVAASMRFPQRQVVGFLGDGGLLMTGNELATARLYGACPILVVSDNASYGTIAMHQQKRYPGRPYKNATDLHAIDIVRWATSFGARGLLIENESQVEDTIADAFSNNSVPVVVHVKSSVEQMTAWRRMEPKELDLERA